MYNVQFANILQTADFRHVRNLHDLKKCADR